MYLKGGEAPKKAKQNKKKTNSYCSHPSGSEIDKHQQWLLSWVKLQRTECTHDLKMSL